MDIKIGDTFKHKGSGKPGYPISCEILSVTSKGYKVKEVYPKNKTKTGFYNKGDFAEKNNPMDQRSLWVRESVNNENRLNTVLEGKQMKSKRRIMLENRLREVIRPIVRSILKEEVVGYIETYVDGKQMLGSDGTRVLQNMGNRAVSTIIDQQINNIKGLSKNVKPYLRDAKSIELRVVTKSGSTVKKIDITSKIR